MGQASSYAARAAPPYTVAPPTTAPSDTILDCTNWAIATSSDTCATLASSNSLTNAQLLSYNPSLAASGCPIVVGDSYCIEENWGAPPATSPLTTTTSTTTTTASPTGNGVTTPSPIQTGMITSCNKFYYVVANDLCTSIVAKFGITLDQLYSWNPAVGSDCESLWSKTYVCVGIIGQATTPTTTTTTTTTTTATTPSNGILTPTPTQSGMVGNCNQFHFVGTGDTCASILSQFGLSLNQFYAWNPAVGADCSSLWGRTYCCVGVVGQTASSTTKTTFTTSTTTTSAGNGVATPTPIEAPMTPNCNRFHYVVDGDMCASIVAAAGISLSDFYAWNPAVGNSCSSLWKNAYVCIGVLR